MKSGIAQCVCAVALLAGLLAIPWMTSADLRDEVIEPRVLFTGEISPDAPASSLLVQATSWPGAPYRYVLTVLNVTPWKIPSLRVLDRYCPADPNTPEITHRWFAPVLESGKAATWVITLADGPLLDGCHQLEIGVADGLDSILMDCSPPGSTTIWRLPLGPEAEAFLSQPPLTSDVADGPSKLGLHVTQNSSPAIMEFVRAAKPAVVMAVGDLGWLADVKAESPSTITVGRFEEGDQSIRGDPRERARAFVEQHRAAYAANPWVDYWLGWNEPVPGSSEEMDWLAAFEAERTVAMAELGLKTGVGNFSVGVPEPYDFERFLPAVRAAKEHGGVLALHEYSAPTMRHGVGAGVPGLDRSDDHGALTLRYRYWYDYYLRANDLVIPLIITEAGIDGGVLAKQGVNLGGWRDFVRPEYLGSDLDHAAHVYVDELSWYDDQVRRDSYVLGFAVFNAGDSGGDWASFDVTDILPQLAGVVLDKQ